MNDYTNNVALNVLINQYVDKLNSGLQNIEGLTAFIKTSPTGILKASGNHAQNRFRPGSKLVTYTGVDAKGDLVKETWNDGIATIQLNSVILKNMQPIKSKNGSEIKGFYSPDGTFKMDQNGDEILFNEYVSDEDFVAKNYGINATESWQVGLKMQPSYVFQLPSDMKEVSIKTPSSIISLTGGDYVIIDFKKGKVNSVQGCNKEWFKDTYTNLADYVKSTKK